jgi:hypothetical protein
MTLLSNFSNIVKSQPCLQRNGNVPTFSPCFQDFISVLNMIFEIEFPYNFFICDYATVHSLNSFSDFRVYMNSENITKRWEEGRNCRN